MTAVAPAVPVRGVAFTVEGTPAPQGSKQAFRRGDRIVLVEMSKRVKPWREAVHFDALDAMNGQAPFTGPIVLTVTFRIARGKTVTRSVPAVRPDLDKLARSTADGLTGVVYADDSQITSLFVQKVYADHTGPGADITCQEIHP